METGGGVGAGGREILSSSILSPRSEDELGMRRSSGNEAEECRAEAEAPVLLPAPLSPPLSPRPLPPDCASTQ